MLKNAAVLGAALLVLTACGNGDDDKAKENIAAELQKDTAMGAQATEEQADCLAEGLVDEIGTEKLQEYKFLTEDLKVNTETTDFDMEKEDAESFASVYVDCIDVEEAVTKQAEGQGKVSDEQKQCIADALDEDTFKAGLAALFQGEQSEEYAAMQGEVQKCMVPATE